MGVFLPERWRTQPTYPARLRSQYQEGLRLAFSPIAGLVDMGKQGFLATLQGSATIADFPEGRAYKFNGSTAYVDVPYAVTKLDFWTGSDPFTVVSCLTVTSLAAVNCISARRNGTGPVWAITTGGDLEMYDGTAFRVAGLSSIVANRHAVVSLSCDGAGVIWQTHGKRVSNAVATTTNFGPASNDYYIGAWDVGVGISGPMAGRQTLNIAWGRQFPRAELQEIGDAPWGVLFEPFVQRSYFVPVAGGAAFVFNPLSGRGGSAAQPLVMH